MQVPKDGLSTKLQRLSSSQQSIESVSSFCIFYHKDARGVVQIWDQEFYKANSERKLALLYLANHILQEGRKKGMGFCEEYFKVLPKALSFVSKQGDEKMKKAAGRLVTVWEERRVFGTKHIKSFREVMGSSSGAGNSSKAAAGGGSAAAAAAGGGDSAAAAAAAADLGPVGEALAHVNARAAAAAGKSREFNSSWSQGTLSTAGLPEVTAAHTQLNAYAAALQEELSARQAAVTALTAEVARQNSEISRLQSQIASAGGQRTQLEQQMATLTQAMTSAMASLGQFMQQPNGGGAAASTPPAVGSPQAPELLLEDDDDLDDAPAQPVLPQVPVTTSAAPPPGVNGGQLGVFMPQPAQQEQPPQPQPQPASQPMSGLQALLGNPAMLSAAILGGAAAGGSAPASSAATGMSGNMVDAGMFGAGFDGFGQLPGTFSAGFGMSTGDQGIAGFADEGEDPYDPTLEG